jgi:predicted RecA/RadA family phage recombinase
LSNIRLERGDPNIISLPKVSTDKIKAGDILWWSGSDSAVRPASKATGTDHNARANVVGTNFVGVAMADRDDGDTGLVPVATTGDFAFKLTGTAPASLAHVRVADNAGEPHNQTLEANTTTAHAVGRVIRSNSTEVRIRLLSRLEER